MRGLSCVGALFLAVLPIVSTPATSAELTAGDLYSFCISKDEMVQTACRFYVLGVVQGVELGDGGYMDHSTHKFVERTKTILCLPDGVGQSQMVLMVTEAMAKTFATYPSDKELPANSTVAAVMNRRFPCGR
jgi:Rap1a immunity proteins